MRALTHMHAHGHTYKHTSTRTVRTCTRAQAVTHARTHTETHTQTLTNTHTHTHNGSRREINAEDILPDIYITQCFHFESSFHFLDGRLSDSLVRSMEIVFRAP